MEKADNGILSGNLQVIGPSHPRIETHSNEILDFVPILGQKWNNGNKKSPRFHLEMVPILGGSDVISSENCSLSSGKMG